MRLGITLPNHYGVGDPRALADLAVAAEEQGYHSVWVGEHLLNSGHISRRLGSGPYYDPLATLSFVAARTTRLRLGTSILVLPLHNPVGLAKYVATLDQFSGGRVVLGVGPGSLVEEFEASGIDWSRRGALMSEALAVMKALWSGDTASHDGATWTFTSVVSSPRPVQRPHVPIWIGGSGKRSMLRAAELGDCWHPTNMSAREIKEGMCFVAEQAVAQGRPRDSIAAATRVHVTFGNERELRPIDNPRVAHRDVAALAELTEDYRSAGVAELILDLNTADAGAWLAAADRFKVLLE